MTRRVRFGYEVYRDDEFIMAFEKEGVITCDTDEDFHECLQDFEVQVTEEFKAQGNYDENYLYGMWEDYEGEWEEYEPERPWEESEEDKALEQELLALIVED